MVGALLAGALLGAFWQQIPRVMGTTRQFEVIDDSGNTRAVMSAAGISYYEENGQWRASMGADGIVYPAAGGSLRRGGQGYLASTAGVGSFVRCP